MSEYTTKKKQVGGSSTAEQFAAPRAINNIPNSVLQDVFAGRRHASNEMMGHRQNLAPSVQAKMSRAFGVDFSGVQLYRSDAMDGTDMRAVTQGNRVVLGSDVDLNTLEGQAVLGHEFAHVRAQSMGIGMGNSGLLNDTALEHQADVEGSMAARGLSVDQGGMSTGAGLSMGTGMAGLGDLTAISGNGGGTAASAPMQAKWGKSRKSLLGLIGGWIKDKYYNIKDDVKGLLGIGQDPAKKSDGEKVPEPGNFFTRPWKKLFALSGSQPYYITEKNINKEGKYGKYLADVNNQVESQFNKKLNAELKNRFKQYQESDEWKNFYDTIDSKKKNYNEADRTKYVNLAREQGLGNVFDSNKNDWVFNEDAGLNEYFEKRYVDAYRNKLYNKPSSKKQLAKMKEALYESAQKLKQKHLNKIINRSLRLHQGKVDGLKLSDESDVNRTGDVDRLTGWKMGDWNPLTKIAKFLNYGNWNSHVSKRAEEDYQMANSDNYDDGFDDNDNNKDDEDLNETLL